jgi:hypothetical protein
LAWRNTPVLDLPEPGRWCWCSALPTLLYALPAAVLIRTRKLVLPLNLYPRKMTVGTVIWTAPSGQTYTTHPGSRLLFPTLCKPTAPVSTRAVVTIEPNRGLMMPRRKNTRAQDRAKRIEAERKLNDAYVAERNKPPPF